KYVKTGVVNLPKASKIELRGTKIPLPIKDITPKYLPKYYSKMVKKYWGSKRKKRKRSSDAAGNELELVGERLKSFKSEDCFDVFGKHIAHKLRRLKDHQNILAQKLINDVLFEAEMEALTNDFKVLNCKEYRGPFL
ncbi:hypothetical protein Anas_12981, partial [Armadillidium nasatum]